MIVRILILPSLALLICACQKEETSSPAAWEGDSALAREFTALNESLAEAYEREDVEALRGMLAGAHIHNNVFGSQLDRETFLADIENGILEFLRYETPDIRWFIRDDVAVATGVITAEAVRGGKPVPANSFRFTRIYVKEPDGWKVLLFHNTMADAQAAE